MKGQVVMLTIPPWIVGPVGFVIVILFGIELLAPRAWILVEGVWWRVALGNSTVSQSLKRMAKKDFKESIAQWAVDSSLPHPLAVLLAIFARPFELRRLTGELKSLKSDMSLRIYESAIRQLNAGWREGKPPNILNGYIKTIMESAGDSDLDDVARLRGRSAVTVVQYALGDFVGSHKLSERNWEAAHRLESDEESDLKWISSYGYFYSTLFLGDFRKAMRLMAEQWSRYYAPLDSSARERSRERLTGHLILNPILAVPRHMILAAAFNERPLFEPKHWPSEAAYDKLNDEERRCKLFWVEAWSKEAREICAAEPTSLCFSNAYIGFYLTLLLLEPNMPKDYLRQKINEAFAAIGDPPTIVAEYVKFGFEGIFHLVNGDDEQALDSLNEAATFSDISGNRFARSLFACCHAVAAARLNRPDRYLGPDIDHYLSEADRMARKIKRPFYRKIFYGAKAAVCHLRGEKAAARRYAAWSKYGEPGNRILKIFFREGEDPDGCR